jgi:hypothetical protein
MVAHQESGGPKGHATATTSMAGTPPRSFLGGGCGVHTRRRALALGRRIQTACPEISRSGNNHHRLVIFALKSLVEYLVDSGIDRFCMANITDAIRDSNPATNAAYVAPLMKRDFFHAFGNVSFPTKLTNRRFFFAWHCRASPWVIRRRSTMHAPFLGLCELLHIPSFAF